eukprot:776481-Pelagomonas_calceolata.AAC.2
MPSSGARAGLLGPPPLPSPGGAFASRSLRSFGVPRALIQGGAFTSSNLRRLDAPKGVVMGCSSRVPTEDTSLQKEPCGSKCMTGRLNRRSLQVTKA